MKVHRRDGAGPSGSKYNKSHALQLDSSSHLLFHLTASSFTLQKEGCSSYTYIDKKGEVAVMREQAARKKNYDYIMKISWQSFGGYYCRVSGRVCVCAR